MQAPQSTKRSEKFVTADFRVWDVESDRELHKLEVQAQRVYSIAFSPDSTKVIVECHDGGPILEQIWDAESGKKLPELSDLWSIVFSPDGKHLFAAKNQILDAESGKELQKLDTPNGYIMFVDFLPAGERIITVSKSKEEGYVAEIWDVESGKKLRSNKLLGLQSEGFYEHFVLSPAGNTIALFDGKNFQLWDIHSGLTFQKWTGYKYLGIGPKEPYSGFGTQSAHCSNHIAFSPDGRQVILWGREYIVNHINW